MGEWYAYFHHSCAMYMPKDQRLIRGYFMGMIPTQSERLFLITLKLAYLQFIFYIGNIHLLFFP
jgi:hypothetical protein